MTDLSQDMIARILSHHQRVEILTYLQNNGCAPETDLAVMVDGRNVCEAVLEKHIPMLVDYGIVEREDSHIVPTDDVDVVVECADELAATITEYRGGDGRNQASEAL